MCKDNEVLMQAVQEILKEDRVKISYRPTWKNMTGSVTSAILLQQIKFRWDNNDHKPFYKFIKPPTSEKARKKYRKGDSWCEELGFTGYEYEGAFKLIGKRLKKDDLADLDTALEGYFVGCIQTRTYETVFYFNEDYFNTRIIDHYSNLVGQNSDDYTQSFGKKPNGNNPIGKKPNGLNANAIQTGKSQTESVSEKANPMISETTKDYQRDTSFTNVKEAARPPVRSKKPKTKKPPETPEQMLAAEGQPKKQLMGTFLIEANMAMPSSKPDIGFWYGRIREILNIAGGDVERGKRLITMALTSLRSNELSVGGPESIVKTVRALNATMGDGAKRGVDKSAVYVPVEPETAEPSQSSLTVDQIKSLRQSAQEGAAA